MRKIRTILSWLCAAALMMALIPAPLAVSAEDTAAVTYDLSDAGKSPILGPISFWYAKCSDYGNPGNISTSIVSDPGKMMLLDTITETSGGDKRYRNGLSDDTYLHFVKQVNGETVMMQCSKDIANVIVFTAPADGTYTYTLSTYSWGDQGTNVDVNANGTKWLTDCTYSIDEKNPPVVTDSTSMKAGEKLYFIFRITMGNVTWGGNTIRQFSITGNVKAPQTPKAGDTYKFNGFALDTSTLSPFSIGCHSGALGSFSGKMTPLTTVKHAKSWPGYAFDYYTSATDTTRHISAGNAYCINASKNNNNIIAFTAPVCGEYTYNLNAHAFNAGQVFISLYANGWTDTDYSLGSDSNKTAASKTVSLKQGDTVFFIVRPANDTINSWAVLNFLSVTLKSIHSPAEKQENKIDSTCCVPGSYDKVTYCKICNAELSRVKETLPAAGDKTLYRVTDDMSVIEVSPEISAANAVVTVKDGLKYGEAEYADGMLRYTPTRAAAGVEDVVLEITSDGHTHNHTVKIVPAPTMYYEDDALTYGDGWEKLTDGTLSGGSAHKAAVSGEQFAKAEFTFTGTGFDLIASTSKTSGTVFVSVKSTAEVSRAKNYLIDTYYTGEKEIKQAPVLKINGLDYGEYTVTVTVGYSAVFAHGRDSYDFVIDAVRVYDPAYGSEEAAAKYRESGIAYPEYIKVRDILIDADSFSNDETVNGAVFIDGNAGTSSVADYKNNGPKNEVYLAKDQAIAFSFRIPTGASMVKIGMRSVYGDSLPCSVGGKDVTVGAAEYADLTGLAGETVVIRNNGEGLLSITDIVVSYSAEKAADSKLAFFLTAKGLDAALSSGEDNSAVSGGAGAENSPETVPDKEIDVIPSDTTVPEEKVTETDRTGADAPETEAREADTDRAEEPEMPAGQGEKTPVVSGGRLADLIGQFIVGVIKSIIAALLG